MTTALFTVACILLAVSLNPSATIYLVNKVRAMLSHPQPPLQQDHR
jgi:hypothetical protein